jgi:hypothetical protein
MVKWDDDIRHNSDNSMETLVRVGERIGQLRNEEERQEYLANNSSGKNKTIMQLLNHFPSTGCLKQSK